MTMMMTTTIAMTRKTMRISAPERKMTMPWMKMMATMTMTMTTTTMMTTMMMMMMMMMTMIMKSMMMTSTSQAS